jgi:DNA-binding MarR family transcriptional regulator
MTNKSMLHDCNLFANRQATRFVSQIYGRHLGKVGLTATQFTILAVLHSKPGMTMNDLAELLVMERTSLVRALQPLTRGGLVVTAPALDNAKRLVISLTKAGEKQFQLAFPAWEAAQAEYEGLVGAKEAKALRNKLHKITQT